MNHAVVVPKVGLTIEEVEVVEWLATVGTDVVAGEPLVVLNADKSDVVVDATHDGVLSAIAADVGEVVKVGAVLGTVEVVGSPDEIEDDPPNSVVREEPSMEPTELAEPPVPPQRSPSVTATIPAERAPSGVSTSAARLRISPFARRLCDEADIAPESLVGTGPDGRIVARDVPSASARDRNRTRLSSAHSADGPTFTRLATSPVRRVIAARMDLAARTTAPVTLNGRADAVELAAVRAVAEQVGLRVTATHVVAWAMTRALEAHPRANAIWGPDGLEIADRVDIGIAVDVDDDLFVPVVRDASSLRFPELVESIDQAVTAARTRRLRPGDSGGATASVSNLGMFGVTSFDPILDPPQLLTLGVGTTEEVVTIVEGRVVARPRISLSLTFDHRGIDGAPAARVLRSIASNIASAGQLLAEIPGSHRR